jgi:hypothetical protein
VPEAFEVALVPSPPMCMNCLSGVELTIMQGTAAAAFAHAGVVRLRERVTGTDPMVRRLAAHEANAAFLADMGLDPSAVLGPPPERATARAPAPAPVRSRRARRAPAPAYRAAVAGA